MSLLRLATVIVEAHGNSEGVREDEGRTGCGSRRAAGRRAGRPPGRRRDTERAMSQRNVEVLPQAYAAWERGDMESLAALFQEHLDPRLRIPIGACRGDHQRRRGPVGASSSRCARPSRTTPRSPRSSSRPATRCRSCPDNRARSTQRLARRMADQHRLDPRARQAGEGQGVPLPSGGPGGHRVYE